MMIFDIITHTPPYVWFIFAYLIYVGLQATKPHAISIPALFVAPLIVLGLRYPFFVHASSQQLLLFGGFACLGTLGGWIFASSLPIRVVPDTLHVLLPAMWHSLLLFVGYFFFQYFFHVTYAISPELHQQFIIPEIIFRGLFSGFLLGKSLFYTYFYLYNS